MSNTPNVNGRIVFGLVAGLGLFVLLISADYLSRAVAPTAEGATPAKTTGHRAVGPLTVADFDNGQAASPWGNWKAIDDKPLQGISTAQTRVIDGGADGTSRALQVSGSSAVWFFPFPFAGVAAPLGTVLDGVPTPRDISGYNGLEFWARGDGKDYLVRFQTDDVSDWNYFHATFRAEPQWKKITIPLASLEQYTWGQRVPWNGSAVAALHFVTNSAPGKDIGRYEFVLDQVRFY